MDYTVIISHFNRQSNLVNCLRGLGTQNRKPAKVIIVNIGEPLALSNTYSYDLEVHQFSKVWEFLPIAAARNLGASKSRTDQLVFLDVDCIPAPDFCGAVSEVSALKNALVMGTPKYLLSNSIEKIEVQSLSGNSVYHPLRPMVQGSRTETCYEMFWSLCFSIPTQLYDRIGGFDETYSGYGCEDTDFALKIKGFDIPFYLCEAEVYHQQHPIYVPPLNHLDSIIRNCNTFKKKWGYWPMADCLRDFRNLKLINWEEQQESSIQILSRPNKENIRDHFVKNAPYR